MTTMTLTRRGFIRTAAAAGGGMILGFSIPGVSKALANTVMPELWKDPAGGSEINAWLTIDADGIVTVRCPHTEMGQGGLTSVCQLIAEELDVPWANVRGVLADANRHVTRGEEYVNMSTGGSNLVRARHPHIMAAGASARERLKEAAAQAWGIPRAEVTASQGVLSGGGKTGTYGEFATAAAGVTLTEEPAIKAYGDWWLLGTPVARMDVAPKVDGSAIYPIDVTVPGMVYASVKACPVPGGVLKSFDFNAIKDRPGVIAAVELKQTSTEMQNADLRSAIAVVADSFYRAKTALDLMPVEWDFGDGVQYSYAGMDAQARELMGQTAEHAEEVRGDPRPIIEAAGNVVSGDYARPYECHVPMGTPAAVADVKPDRVDIWSFTQNVAATLLLAAEQAGVDPANVFMHGTFQAGAFGNGNQTDVPRQAVEISKQVGRPVKVIWTREEDVTQARTRPPVWGRYQAVLGDDGLPTAMLIRAIGEIKNPAYADRGHVNMPYLVPNFRFERHVVPTNLPIGPNRAPGNNSNGFMLEQYIDEVALAGGWDPLDWRIKMTEGNERWQRVLLKMKEVGGFTTDLPKGTGMGVAVVESHGSTVGAIATVEVSRRGNLYIDKITIVSNSGYVINPRAAEEQVKSSIIWELSHMLYGGLKFENGRIQNVNFDNYKLMRLPDTPKVETIYANSEDQWWGGFGETATPPTPPAIANAIFFATGKRVRTTPIVAHDLSWS
ncbi:MAG TPA: molybdopterin cofactor-binding domain-containing protein [Paracoccaceae bacterium]|nr:molybdopterin cofactor-binding domain-containing protein [Paracoccaceae bacterium]